MADLLIRDVDEALDARLQTQAAAHGRSPEEEARDILRSALRAEEPPNGTWVDEIRAIVERFGGVDLPIPPREPMRDPPIFE